MSLSSGWLRAGILRGCDAYRCTTIMRIKKKVSQKVL
jgi:hypothetical protein